MSEPDRCSSSLKKCYQWLEEGNPALALRCFRSCGPSAERDLGLAETLLEFPDGAPEAYKILLGRYLAGEASMAPDLRARMLKLLRKSAQIADPETAALLDGSEAQGTANKNSVLKAFFLRPHGKDGATLWQKTRDAKGKINLRQGRNIASEGYTIQFAKTFSSVTSLMGLSPDGAAGGGYFLNLDRKSVV